MLPAGLSARTCAAFQWNGPLQEGSDHPTRIPLCQTFANPLPVALPRSSSNFQKLAPREDGGQRVRPSIQGGSFPPVR
jgi:hypothetical protein